MVLGWSKTSSDGEPTERDLIAASHDRDAISRIEPDGAQESLTRYFKDLEHLPVMTAADEAVMAKEFKESEIYRWRVALSYPPVYEQIAYLIVQHLDELEVTTPDEIIKLEKILIAYRSKFSHTRFTREMSDKWQALVETLAVKMRTVDLDRKIIECVIDESESGDFSSTRGKSQFAAELSAASARVMKVKNKFITSNLRLVASVAKKYSRGPLPMIDLIQDGNIGLMKAVERFDYERGHRFSTYASWWIRHAVSRALADKGREVRIPVHMLDMHVRTLKTSEKIYLKTGHRPTLQEIAEVSNTPLVKIERVENEWVDSSASLDKNVSNYDGDQKLLDTIPDDEAQSPHDMLESALWAERVKELMEFLSPIEKKIIGMRFGFDSEDDGMTLQEVGQRHSLTRERVRQIQEAALDKIRKNMIDFEDDD